MNDSIDFEAIGQRLRKIRKARAMSVMDSSRATGMASGIISAVELGHRNPGLGTLVSFADVYGCGLDELVFGEPRPASTASASTDETVDATDRADENMTPSELNNIGRTDGDPYFITLRNSMSQMDEDEKEFMVRLVLNAHSEFSIVKAKGR